MQKPTKTHKNRDKKPKKPSANHIVLYGLHPVIACIHNPHRIIKQICTCDEVYNALPPSTKKILSNRAIDIKLFYKKDISQMVGENVPHQGIIASVLPLPPVHLESVMQGLHKKDKNIVVVLDQVCDPHNIGAIFRSSALFGAKAVIVVDKNSPHETAVLAKSASGALEKIPFVRVNNIKQCLKTLQKHNFWCVGLSGSTHMDITNYTPTQNTALIVGAEGMGMRRLTEQTCDILVRIHTPNADTIIDSLNVSNATAIALHYISTKNYS